jgi:hypothetical protein
MSNNEFKEILMKYDKETIVTLYISAKKKADKCDELKNILSEILAIKEYE